MNAGNNNPEIVWFAMSAPYRRELKAKDFLEARGIECFVPMTKVAVERAGGVKKRETVPAIHNLIFVHTTQESIKELKRGNELLQYRTLPRDGKNVPVIVPEKEMQQFIAVTQARMDEICYLKPEEINLEKGTKVRLHGGSFDGIEGIFVKVKGKRNRRVVVMIEGIAAVAINTEISPDLIEVL